MKYLIRPYNLLALAGIFLLPFSFLVPGDQTFDIHLHDTYFIINGAMFVQSIVALLLISWVIYLITNKILLSRWLTWIHIITTLAAITMAIPFGVFSSNKYERWLWIMSGDPIPWFMILFIVAQIILLINITGGIIKQVIKKQRPQQTIR